MSRSSNRRVPFDYTSLVASEKATREKTLSQYERAGDCVADCIEVLLQLPRFFGPTPAVDTEEGFFDAWAAGQYVEVTYSLRAALGLWLRGYYGQAMVLLRHVLESFVQVRYFLRQKTRLRQHWLGHSRGATVGFKTMFEAVAPDYYEAGYARILSGFAHGGKPLRIWRLDYKRPSSGRPARMSIGLGCDFNGRAAHYVMLHLLLLSYGFLKLFPNCFPGHLLRVDEKVESQRRALLTEIETLIRGRWNSKGSEEHHIRLTKLLVDFGRVSKAND